jgi:cytochrome c oxidase subunit 1
MNETVNKIHFWTTFIPFNLIFLPLFLLGLAGQHRRIYDFTNFPQLSGENLQHLRIVATTSLIIMLIAQIPFIINFFWSMFNGKKAEKNPWKANTLEWTVDSPPPHGNWPELPAVYRGPYEYSVPGRKDDYWPQNEPAK